MLEQWISPASSAVSRIFLASSIIYLIGTVGVTICPLARVDIAVGVAEEHRRPGRRIVDPDVQRCPVPRPRLAGQRPVVWSRVWIVVALLTTGVLMGILLARTGAGVIGEGEVGRGLADRGECRCVHAPMLTRVGGDAFDALSRAMAWNGSSRMA